MISDKRRKHLQRLILLKRKRGYWHSEETRRKIGLGNKGKIVSKEIRKKVSLALTGRKFSKEHKKRLRENNPRFWLGKKRPSLSKETRKKIGLGNKGKKRTEETRKKISLARTGKRLSEEQRKKLSESHKGRKFSKEHKQKMRLAMIKYIEEVCGGIRPNIGRNESQILDKLEQELNHKILRQFKCNGYFLDGYIPEIKLAIEIDERPKILEKDIEREKIIKIELGCELLRIKDYH